MALVADRPGHIHRRLVDVIASRLLEEPVIVLQGPRTVGKSTLLREIAAGRNARLLDLDDLATRDAVAADPALFVAGRDLVCVDEVQHVPALYDAIKAELNRDLRPGRFVLTRSTRSDVVPVAAQALTGRMHLLTVYPLSQGEIAGVRESMVEELFQDAWRAVDAGRSSESARSAYIDRVTAGGFPLAIARSHAGRGRWIDDFVASTLERDVRELAKVRQRARLPQLLRSLAGQTAQVLNIANAARAVGMDERTAENYTRLLEAVFLVQRLPSWGTTLRSRVAARPKVHVVDSAVAARLLRLDLMRLERLESRAMTQFGHLLETFVVAEIAKQTSWLDDIVAMGHWRTHDGLEVDLVIERADGGVVAFEVKASGRIDAGDLRALRSLREVCGESFIAGIALYLGRQSYTLEDRLHALPVDRLWTPVR